MQIYTKKYWANIFMSLLLTLGPACSMVYQDPEQTKALLAREVSISWNRLLLDLERYTPGYRPPVSARMYAYVSMAAYEAALPGFSAYPSLGLRWKALHSAGLPTWYTGEFITAAALNRAYAQMAHHFFPTAPLEWQAKIDALAQEFTEKINQVAPAAAVKATEAYAEQVAGAVWRWSITDEMGHDGFLFNYDRNYKSPACAGCWQPTGERAMPSLLPHWGEVRTFVVSPSEVKARSPLSYDETPGSAYYKQSLEVFALSQPRSKENTWVAEFWSDDLPGLTMTPVGRWISIATQAIECEKMPIAEVLQTYLLCSIALGDAAVLCWQLKYKYHIERPETYINRVVHKGWQPLHGTPSFPSYPSGHSMFGAAAAEVLTAQFGEPFAMTDRTHEGRDEFEGAPRHFDSFRAMARENAFSRLALGVHYRMDCEEGLRLGEIVGQKVADLRFVTKVNQEISRR